MWRASLAVAARLLLLAGRSSATQFPTSAPVFLPTPLPTSAPTLTKLPTSRPSSTPSPAPSGVPSPAPSAVPTSPSPTSAPTAVPSPGPSATPSIAPTPAPSSISDRWWSAAIAAGQRETDRGAASNRRRGRISAILLLSAAAATAALAVYGCYVSVRGAASRLKVVNAQRALNAAKLLTFNSEKAAHARPRPPRGPPHLDVPSAEEMMPGGTTMMAVISKEVEWRDARAAAAAARSGRKAPAGTDDESPLLRMSTPARVAAAATQAADLAIAGATVVGGGVAVVGGGVAVVAVGSAGAVVAAGLAAGHVAVHVAGQAAAGADAAASLTAQAVTEGSARLEAALSPTPPVPVVGLAPGDLVDALYVDDDGRSEWVRATVRRTAGGRLLVRDNWDGTDEWIVEATEDAVRRLELSRPVAYDEVGETRNRRSCGATTSGSVARGRGHDRVVL